MLECRWRNKTIVWIEQQSKHFFNNLKSYFTLIKHLRPASRAVAPTTSLLLILNLMQLHKTLNILSLHASLSLSHCRYNFIATRSGWRELLANRLFWIKQKYILAVENISNWYLGWRSLNPWISWYTVSSVGGGEFSAGVVKGFPFPTPYTEDPFQSIHIPWVFMRCGI